MDNLPSSHANNIYLPGSDKLTIGSRVTRVFSEVKKPFLFSDLAALKIKKAFQHQRRLKSAFG